jgi:hypothetical protein
MREFNNGLAIIDSAQSAVRAAPVGQRRRFCAGRLLFRPGDLRETRYPVVLGMAVGKIPVAVTCRVLGFSKQALYVWRLKMLFCDLVGSSARADGAP